ncbi:hypothetical protein BST81_10420 [Leptolyngbya sp. 'hensonii']|nr:hypothetical protein BST81_10420 [Leptolyngbya sp. 'hensonii']
MKGKTLRRPNELAVTTHVSTPQKGEVKYKTWYNILSIELLWVFKNLSILIDPLSPLTAKRCSGSFQPRGQSFLLLRTDIGGSISEA